MIEREKVVKGLKYCVHDYMGDCDNCPYNDNSRCCDTKLMRDAIALLELPTCESISSAIECLLHPQDADDSDMAKAIDTAVHAMQLLKAQENEIEELKQEIEGYEDDLRETLDEMMRYADELKAQEPIRPNEIWQGNVLVYYQCSACTSTLLTGDKYCAWCGRKVKWE